jgi:AcrR family transcriptional regulator
VTRNKTRDHPDNPENPFVAQWLETTRSYLLAHQQPSGTGNNAAEAPPASVAETRGAQVRGIARVRGQLLRLTMRRPVDDPDPVRELERIFHSLVSFIARNSDVPSRMLRWSTRSGHRRIQRRVQMVIDQFVARVSFIIKRAQAQARIRPDVEPQTAAVLFVGIAQSLVLRLFVGFLPREQLQDEANRLLQLYLTGMRSAPLE